MKMLEVDELDNELLIPPPLDSVYNTVSDHIKDSFWGSVAASISESQSNLILDLIVVPSKTLAMALIPVLIDIVNNSTEDLQ